eukprot:Pgem_evm1s18155
MKLINACVSLCLAGPAKVVFAAPNSEMKAMQLAMEEAQMEIEYLEKKRKETQKHAQENQNHVLELMKELESEIVDMKMEAAVTAQPIQSFVVYPTGITTVRGATYPDALTALELKRLEKAESTIGTNANIPNGAYEFDPNVTNTNSPGPGLEVYFKFQTTQKAVRDRMTSVALTARFKGADIHWNEFQFKLRNYVTGKYQFVADNNAAPDGGDKWVDLTGNYSFRYTDNSYMNENGEMEVMYSISGIESQFNPSFLDRVQLTFNINEPRQERPQLPPTPPNPATPVLKKNLPWTQTAKLCGCQITQTLVWESNAQKQQLGIENAVNPLKEQFCSVLEVDSGLSFYHNDTAFNQQISFLNKLSQYAEQQGLKTVLYIPTLEVQSHNGCDANFAPNPHTMASQKPEQLQKNINPKKNGLNYFCGEGQEVWVKGNEESAWFDPNNPEYRQHFLGRVTRLAAETKMNGLWGDVPIYSDTAHSWAGMSKNSLAEFTAFTKDQGYNNGQGYSTLPTVVNGDLKNDEIFRAWIQWRHFSLDNWQDSITLAGEAGNKDFIFAAEIYSVDYLDGYWIGLDGGYKKNNRQFRVWEIDSVSNTNAMNYATIEDFRNKIAMNKYAVAADNGQHSWLFAYGSAPLDSGLVMGAIAGIGASPFDSKTPVMTQTVGKEYRTRWYSWLQEMEYVIYDFVRSADVGVVYSTPTRDYIDSQTGCKYGMFAETTPLPSTDESWWSALGSGSSVVLCDHIGSYRGTMNALNKFQTSHKVVIDTSVGFQSLNNLKVVFLPSVQAISDTSAAAIKQYVANGGVLFITGAKLPGTHDELGNLRAQPVFANDLLKTPGGSDYTQAYEKGTVIYRPTITARSLFEGEKSNPESAPPSQAEYEGKLNSLEEVIRQHVRENVIIFDEENEINEKVYVELGTNKENTQQAIYVTNLEGLRQPVQSVVTPLNIKYRAPDGTRVKSASIYTPDEGKWSGKLDAIEQINGGQWFTFPTVVVEQFITIVIELENKQHIQSAQPTFNFEAGWEQVINNGFDFIKTKMRDPNQPEPRRFGVFTNFKDITAEQEDVVYANGHHVTAEHMGLFMRVASCLGDKEAHNEGFSFINELMTSNLKNVINWAIDKETGIPLIQSFEEGSAVNANAPLDDMRAIRGIIAGARLFSNNDASLLAERTLQGLMWTTVTNKYRGSSVLPKYHGLIGYSYDWSETEQNANGNGHLGIDPIPIDYSLLWTVEAASGYNPRWIPILDSSIQMLLDSEIGTSGLFYNGIQADGTYTGDFEYRDLTASNRGKHLKTIQTLWIAIHLAEIGTSETSPANAQLRAQAKEKALRSLTKYKQFYTQNGRVPEYMTYDGQDVPKTGPLALKPDENLVAGEARIYAQIGRLAHILGDATFAKKIVNEKIVPDVVTDQQSPLFGSIGIEAFKGGDQESWNTLESLVTMCMISGGIDGTVGSEFLGEGKVGENLVPIDNTTNTNTPSQPQNPTPSQPESPKPKPPTNNPSINIVEGSGTLISTVSLTLSVFC